MLTRESTSLDQFRSKIAVAGHQTRTWQNKQNKLQVHTIKKQKHIKSSHYNNLSLIFERNTGEHIPQP
jgi:hypothetical protein